MTFANQNCPKQQEANIIHKEFVHKEFWDPKTPSEIFMFRIFLYFEGQRGPPCINNLGGQGLPGGGGGSAWEVSVEILSTYAFCGGLKQIKVDQS